MNAICVRISTTCITTQSNTGGLIVPRHGRIPPSIAKSPRAGCLAIGASLHRLTKKARSAEYFSRYSPPGSRWRENRATSRSRLSRSVARLSQRDSRGASINNTCRNHSSKLRVDCLAIGASLHRLTKKARSTEYFRDISPRLSLAREPGYGTFAIIEVRSPAVAARQPGASTNSLRRNHRPHRASSSISMWTCIGDGPVRPCIPRLSLAREPGYGLHSPGLVYARPERRNRSMLHVPLGFARCVAVADHGSSGHGCFG